MAANNPRRAAHTTPEQHVALLNIINLLAQQAANQIKQEAPCQKNKPE